jgi:hypothetical protein
MMGEKIFLRIKKFRLTNCSVGYYSNYIGISLLIIFTQSTVSVFSQSMGTTYKTVQVLKENEFYLNGGRISLVGGKSRTAFQVKLPPNTVKWYYSFTTAQGNNPTNQIQLFSKLTRIVDRSGITEIALNEIMAPRGTGICDVFITDKKNMETFIDKADLFGKSFSHYHSLGRSNSRRDAVKIDNLFTDDLWICFKNPSASTGVSIKFEVVAIVEEKSIIKEWDKDNRQFIFDLCYEESHDTEYCGCAVKTLVERISFSDLMNLANFEADILFKEIDNICAPFINKETQEIPTTDLQDISSSRIRLTNISSRPKTIINKSETAEFRLVVNPTGRVEQVRYVVENSTIDNNELINELISLIKLEVFYKPSSGEYTTERYVIRILPN